ncbi:MAG: RnfABCDGE type electron transport complex subunit D [Candidatus Cloacimonetes bacterium]|nr:RnfABCDGE type electron transport complex subunit D [Candidatus Cloacimonadota bacterium]
MNQKYIVSAAPHLKEKQMTVSSVMWQVVLALMPALAMAVFFYGFKSLALTVYGVFAAIVTEYAIQKLRKIPVSISDGSAVVTGILVAFNLNVASPWWLPVIGSVFAIAIGKQIFGGLGHNLFNPALLGRAFLLASWPSLVTANWTATKPAFSFMFNSINGLNPASIPAAAPAAFTGATPLAAMKTARELSDSNPELAQQLVDRLASVDTISNIFLGNIGGVIGEVSALALLIGAAFLAYRYIISWRIPISYIFTVFILTYAFGGMHGLFSASILLPVFHIFSGGLILGAFFMATDMVTSPVTRKGMLIFGIGAGILTTVIRLWGGYPEGVSYSILLMNCCVPLIDKWSAPKPFGEVKK